jgi:hypothetical protein
MSLGFSWVAPDQMGRIGKMAGHGFEHREVIF